jgi:hypothetical protein
VEEAVEVMSRSHDAVRARVILRELFRAVSAATELSREGFWGRRLVVRVALGEAQLAEAQKQQLQYPLEVWHFCILEKVFLTWLFPSFLGSDSCSRCRFFENQATD